MLHRFLILGFLAALAACGGATGGKVPVDHPIYEHKPPEVEDEEVDDEDEAEAEGEEATE